VTITAAPISPLAESFKIWVRIVASEKDAGLTARLLGAAAALREAAGMPLPPVYRKQYDHVVAIARTQLGDAAHTAAWAAGNKLPRAAMEDLARDL
jgi:hypothetical protein